MNSVFWVESPEIHCGYFRTGWFDFGPDLGRIVFDILDPIWIKSNKDRIS